MKIKVDFFKASGKWYAGGEVDIGNFKPWDGDLRSIVWEKQNILSGRSKEFYIITDNVSNEDPFCKFLLAPEKT